MKTLLFVSLISLTSLCFAAEWKVVAETVGCPEKVQVLAKEGESYVIASHDGHHRKLYADDGRKFSPQNMGTTEYNSDTNKEKYLLGEPTFRYTHPSYVEGNPPKIDVSHSGRSERCRMNLK